jgi:replication-associated recombination protein RarA
MISDVNNYVSRQKTRKPLFSCILRPQALGDLALPTQTIQRLQRVIDSGAMVNMVFYGPPGSGKTSAARIFMDAIGGRTVNRVSARRANLAKRVDECALRWDPGICFVDQVHLISKRDQTALPDIIDRWSSRCRFFLAATDIKKLIPELRSRLAEISFEVAPKDREEVQKRLMKRYENMLPANGYKFDRVRLEQIVDANFPDLRLIANHIEFEFG